MSQRVTLLRQKLQAVTDAQVVPNVQTTSYRIILNNILNNGNTDTEELLLVFFEMLIREDVNLVVSRKILTLVTIKILPELSDVQSKLLAQTSLAQIRSRPDVFVHQAADICQYLAKIYEKENNWKDAAELLITIDLRKFSHEYAFENYINIARLYLEDGQASNAETYIKKATKFLITVDNELLQIRYKKMFTQILEYQNKFVEAALQYYELSVMISLPQEICLSFYKNSFECAVLSSIGPTRFRMFSLLYRDERSTDLAEFLILRKLCFSHILTPKDISEIYGMLQPNKQNAKTADGVSIFHLAILEHNIFGVSKVYKNIFIDSLGYILGVDARTAESAVANMISEDRIHGSIDQIDNLIHFRIPTDNLLLRWTNGIKMLCTHVNTLVDLIRHHQH